LNDEAEESSDEDDEEDEPMSLGKVAGMN